MQRHVRRLEGAQLQVVDPFGGEERRIALLYPAEPLPVLMTAPPAAGCLDDVTKLCEVGFDRHEEAAIRKGLDVEQRDADLHRRRIFKC